MVDEIAMNPVYFSIRTIKATLSTLVHEMVHQWQFHFGKAGRRGYHNKEWAALMERVGLMPSDTGQPGGRKVGQSMTHYIITGGAFDRACDELLTRNFQLSGWTAFLRTSRSPERRSHPAEKVTSMMKMMMGNTRRTTTPTNPANWMMKSSRQ